MKGVDTNVLMRFIVRDDDAQAESARAFLRASCTREDPCLINRIVLCELAWMLERGFRYPRETVADTIERLLRTEELEVEDTAEAWAALAEYRRGRTGFVDCLIAKTNKALGRSETITFDRSAGRLEGFHLLE